MKIIINNNGINNPAERETHVKPEHRACNETSSKMQDTHQLKSTNLKKKHISKLNETNITFYALNNRAVNITPTS